MHVWRLEALSERIRVGLGNSDDIKGGASYRQKRAMALPRFFMFTQNTLILINNLHYKP